MKRFISVLALGALLAAMLVAMAAPAFGEGRGCNELPEYIQGTDPEAGVGKGVSDDFYGNEPNINDPYAPGGPQEQEPGTQAGRVDREPRSSCEHRS
jgi:hypothetical protein